MSTPHPFRTGAVGFILALGLVLAGPTSAQEDPAQRLEALERTVAELRASLALLQGRSDAQEAEVEELQQRLEDAEAQAEQAGQALARAEFAGTSSVLVAGDAFVDYTDVRGESGTATVGFNPHFYWKVGARTLFGAGVELELGDRETETSLEWAQVFYDLGHGVSLGFGKFLMPFGYFQENIHSAYIDKLPDEPLAVGDDFVTPLAPPHDLGLQLRGPLSVGGLRFDFALYVTNGPELDVGDDDPRTAGSLRYENFHDANDSKAVGGRLGFQPRAGLELGYSVLAARVGPDGTPLRDVDALLQGVDLSYVVRSPSLRGNLDLRAEWIRADVDAADFGAGLQDNDREGGYAQLAYRPTEIEGALGDLEAVVRLDEIHQPAGSALDDETRTTIGLDYWEGPTSVFKLAYQTQDGDGHAWLLQYALGF